MNIHQLFHEGFADSLCGIFVWHFICLVSRVAESVVNYSVRGRISVISSILARPTRTKGHRINFQILQKIDGGDEQGFIFALF
jgi:hypothetical protein